MLDGRFKLCEGQHWSLLEMSVRATVNQIQSSGSTLLGDNDPRKGAPQQVSNRFILLPPDCGCQTH
jgi:hypothetical protein